MNKKKLISLAAVFLFLVSGAAVIFKLNTKINNLNNASEQLNQEMRKQNDWKKIVNANDNTTIICNTESSESGQYIFEQLSWPVTWGGFAYALKTPEGQLILFDGGLYDDGGELIKQYILENGGVVDHWFISHPHTDHVGALLYNLDDNAADRITVKNVYYSPFTEEYFEHEDEATFEALNNASQFHEFNAKVNGGTEINFVPMTAQDTMNIEDAAIECMHSFDSQIPDVNSNSLVLRLDIKGVTFMITGDMTHISITQMLELYPENDARWDVDFLQIPHHGYVAGIHDDQLYRLTNARYAFLDCAYGEYEDNAVNILEQEQWVINLGTELLYRFRGINTIIIN